MAPPEIPPRRGLTTPPVAPVQTPISVPSILPVPPAVSGTVVNIPSVEPQTVIPLSITPLPPVAPVPPVESQQVGPPPVVPVQPVALTTISPFQGMTLEMQQAMYNHFMAAMQGGSMPAVQPLAQPALPTVQPNQHMVPQVEPQGDTGAVQPSPPVVQPVVQQPATIPIVSLGGPSRTVQPPSLTIPSNVMGGPPTFFQARAGLPPQLGGSQTNVTARTTATNQQPNDGTSSGVTAEGSSSGYLEDGEEVEDA